jgi:hypothetical protein
MVLRWREVVKGEKGEIKKTEDSPALVEVENFDFDTDHSECFLSQGHKYWKNRYQAALYFS